MPERRTARENAEAGKKDAAEEEEDQQAEMGAEPGDEVHGTWGAETASRVLPAKEGRSHVVWGVYG